MDAQVAASFEVLYRESTGQAVKGRGLPADPLP
jgi:hypothetical protein